MAKTLAPAKCGDADHKAASVSGGKMLQQNLTPEADSSSALPHYLQSKCVAWEDATRHEATTTGGVPRFLQSKGEEKHKKRAVAMDSSAAEKQLPLDEEEVPSPVQKKVTVGAADDPLEREADQVAEHAMRTPDSEAERRPYPREEEGGVRIKPVSNPLSRKETQGGAHLSSSESDSTGGSTVSAGVDSAINTLPGRGQPVPESVRSFMEPRFGMDFGATRFHTGSHAHDLARSVNARAFTVGRDVVFGAGQYAPETTNGKRLIAHELAHVVQQRGAQLQRYPPDPSPGSTMQASFEPTFQIEPGGLGAGRERTQQTVFRGDTLVFTARLQDIPSAVNQGVDGRVVGSTAPSCQVSGDTATWRVVVGNMGTPGRPGEPAEQVDATPWLELLPPLINAGRRFSHTYRFRVVADYAWLSGQCSTAGANLQSAFLGVSSLIDEAYLNYQAAYEKHRTAVDNHGRRKQLEHDVLVGILLAGIGGAAGGKVADLLKAGQGVATATAVGDIVKYSIRLGGMRAPGRTGTQGSDTPNPTGSPGTAQAAGITPERWKALKEREMIDAAKAGVDACNELKQRMDEAWAQGRTELMDLDPVQVVQPTVDDLSADMIVKTEQEYAVELWRTWIDHYGITRRSNWAGGVTYTDELQGHTAFTDSKLFDDIHAQIGNELDSYVGQLRSERAPDPLTERPD
jgi:hypothetical protein